MDGIYLRRNWGGEFENVAILVAIAVDEDGYRQILGAAEGMKEDKASWGSFFQWLRGRGLDGVKLVVGDKCLGMLEAVGEVFPPSQVPALYRPLLPQCILRNALFQGKTGGKDTQSDPAQESKKSCPGESQSLGRAAALYEDERGRQKGEGCH